MANSDSILLDTDKMALVNEINDIRSDSDTVVASLMMEDLALEDETASPSTTIQTDRRERRKRRWKRNYVVSFSIVRKLQF